MRELETQLIQEWREQNQRFTLGPPNHESEEEIERCNTLKNRQGSDDIIKQNEREVAEKRMVQLKAMVEQLKKLIFLHNEKENEHPK